MSEIRGVNLRKRWGKAPDSPSIFQGVNLCIAPGEFVAIVGDSGSGKSTLLRLLGGLDAHYEGEVLVDGQALRSLKERERSALRNQQFAFVFQDFLLLPHLTVEENMRLPFTWSAQRPDALELKRAVAELLEDVGLREKASQFPAALSGGEQQRVATARALMQRPKVLFCDEPTASLDAANAARVMEAIETYHQKSGCSVVLISHDPSILRRASRVLELRDGALNERTIASLEEVQP